MIARLAYALMAAFLFSQTLAFGDSITLIPSADTSIMEVTPTNNAGARAWINAGSNMHGQRNRGLIKFDIAASLPANSRITSASLTLAVTGIPSDGYAIAYFDLHRLLRPWGEGDKNSALSPGQGLAATTNEATWLSPLSFTTNYWTVPGAAATNDYAAVTTASQIVYDTIQSPYYFPDPADDDGPMIADLQSWLDNPAANFGWILICESEEMPSTARRFASREDPDSSPQLTITYDPPPQLTQISHSGNQCKIEFTAQAGHTYSMEFRNSLTGNNEWNTLTNLPAQTLTTNILVTDPIVDSQRFYRLRTP
ncbi:DNRLRE domain-containing protein [Pedosphaera parvula]|uniref:DNRLRE domain-containing protein n=1 Tax=Pedosphaera parvula (strain Ellin514) TaxID=320771 RepID=B9XJG0_PEDPL|nr:DNRLRE domain-containing protein [Pedosphaera parvula]EEF60021.1 hypothetical protein Cflav_PD3080 [Pedosphaera parvula Ellin514]